MTTEAFPYSGNLTWLRDRAIFVATHGSRAYGLATPTSDLDIKGVAVPPRRYFHGYADVFEQAESKDPDMVVYGIQKFFRLAADCNPNIVEILWTDESDWRLIAPAGRRLVDARALFLSKRARWSFAGYAFSQLKRIRLHRRYLLNPITSPPTRSEYGLPDRTVIPSDQLEAAQAAIQKKLDTWNLGDLSGVEPSIRQAIQTAMAEMLAEAKVTSDSLYAAAARTVGYDENFIRLLDLERQYKARKTEWEHYQNWKATRNPARAEMEARFGFDGKHATHLVRLLKMCEEILTLGRVIVKRPDREELLSIRQGAWSYDQLIEWAEAQEKKVAALYETSTLPKTPDRDKLDALCISVVEESMS